MNGLWHYSIEDQPQFVEPDLDDSSWKTMLIPSNWFLGGLDQHGVVWFRYEFDHLYNDEPATLHFDGVDYSADVYLNGRELGHHNGYFEPFAFEVTGVLRTGKNVLAVRVDSPYEAPGPDGWHMKKRLVKGVLNHHDCRPGGGWDTVGQSNNTGGIWNRVYLEQHGKVTIDRLLLRADLNSEPPTLYVELELNNRGRKRHARFEVQISPENFNGKSQVTRFKLELQEGRSFHSVIVPVKAIHLWMPWDRGFPHLYNVSGSLTTGGETTSSSSLFGFRSVRVESGFHWFINDKSYFPRGSNYLPSQWLSETLDPDIASRKEHPFNNAAGGEFYLRDVTLAKQANLNILRVHAHVLPQEFHEVCDRAGMLVWQDFPLQWGYSDEPHFQVEAERQIKAMVSGLYNHPSIIAWCCHNESPSDAPWMAGKAGTPFDPTHNRNLDEQLEKTVREMDPTRYVHRNSGTGDGHVYPGWYVGHWRDFQETPGTPFLTEYGAQGLPVRQTIQRMFPQFGPDAGFADLKRFKTWLDSLKKINPIMKSLIKFGTIFWKLAEKNHWESIKDWMKSWGIRMERSAYMNIPPLLKTPQELISAREVWETWRFHDFQPAETFDNGIALGNNLDQFITNSQAYQSHLIQYATECYRRNKYKKVTGVIQFDFCDPWPAVTWSVLDYWRNLKPSFYSLQRSMQTVLPTFNLPEKIEAGKAIQSSFCVVNDLTQAFPASSCEWRLEGGTGDIANATFPLDIPADGVSAETRITMPSLGPGMYKLYVTVTSSKIILGENLYELNVQ